MRMLTALVCKMWRGTSFQHQKPTLLSFLRSEAHTKKQQIRCDRALKLQVPFDFPLGVSSCPICALAAALTDSQTTFMCWNGPFTFLQILVWGIFFKLKHEHNVAGDILSGGHPTLPSRLQAVGTSLWDTLLGLISLMGKTCFISRTNKWRLWEQQIPNVNECRNVKYWSGKVLELFKYKEFPN